MEKKKFEARINAVPYNADNSVYNLYKCSEEFDTLEELKDYVKEHDWSVGEVKTFGYRYEEHDDCGAETEYVDLEIESVDYLEKTETYIKIDPDTYSDERKNNVKKKKQIGYFNFHYHNDSGFDKTFIVLGDADNYRDKFVNYLRENGISIPSDAIGEITFELFENQDVII